MGDYITTYIWHSRRLHAWYIRSTQCIHLCLLGILVYTCMVWEWPGARVAASASPCGCGSWDKSDRSPGGPSSSRSKSCGSATPPIGGISGGSSVGSLLTDSIVFVGVDGAHIIYKYILLLQFFLYLFYLLEKGRCQKIIKRGWGRVVFVFCFSFPCFCSLFQKG